MEMIGHLDRDFRAYLIELHINSVGDEHARLVVGSSP